MKVLIEKTWSLITNTTCIELPGYPSDSRIPNFFRGSKAGSSYSPKFAQNTTINQVSDLNNRVHCSGHDLNTELKSVIQVMA